MSYTTAKRTSAVATSIVAFITYVLTAAPSVSFWRAADLASSASVFGIPEPPVAPFWLLLARIALAALPGDVAHSTALLSSLFSAATAGVIVLIVCSIVERWFVAGDPRRTLPAIGGGVVAALSFAWSDSQWRAATVASTEPLAVLLVATALLLVLQWSGSAHTRDHARYLLAAAFVLGLLAGVDARLLIIVPALCAIVFLRSIPPTASSIAVAIVTAIAGGWAFDRLVTSWLPALLDGSSLLFILAVPAVLALVFAVWTYSTDGEGGPIGLAAAVCAVALLGATSVLVLPLRGAAHAPTSAYTDDADEPIARLVGVDAASDAPFWPRRWSIDPERRRFQDRYGAWTPAAVDDPMEASIAAEVRFLWHYQLVHMYLRYGLWNYVGRASDDPDAPPAWFSSDGSLQDVQQTSSSVDPFPIRFYALPLLLALIGLFWHVRRDPRMAVALAMLFLLSGPGLVLAASLQQPQVRERDAMFLASFLVVALWTGIAAAAIAAGVASDRGEDDDAMAHDAVAPASENGDRLGTGVAGVAIALCLLAGPVNMLVGGWTAHDRSTTRVAWDYAYNLLQSCDSNAVLLTAGDNDTFPLIYLQDVDGVRRDVRVVNLRMMNDPAYLRRISGMSRWSSEALPLTILDSLEGTPGAFAVEVGPPPTITIALHDSAAVASDSMRSRTSTSMTWLLRGPVVGGEGMHMLRLQERAVVDLLRTNAWKRPVYFSSSVPVPERAGLDDYLRREGLAFRVVPQRRSTSTASVETTRTLMSIMSDAPGEHSTVPHRTFLMRGLAGAPTYLDPEERRVVALYRHAYVTLAETALSSSEDARAILATMEERIPSRLHPMPYWMSAGIASLYMRAGDPKAARTAALRAIDAVDAMGSEWRRHPHARTYHPVQVKARMLALINEYDRAIAAYDELRRAYPNDPHLRGQIEELRIERYLSARDTAGALAEIDAIIAAYASATDATLRNNAAAFGELALELRGRDSTARRSRGGRRAHE